MPGKKIVIVGAGLAGLSAAFHIKKDFEIFEKEAQPGGLCRSNVFNGFTFDYGGHLLHFQHEYTRNLIKKLLGKNLKSCVRDSWIHSFGHYTRYPFQIHTYGLPYDIKRECVLEFIKARLKNSNGASKRNNFDQWVRNSFGNGMARNFMIPYNKKFWTVHPRRLNCEWIDGFVPIPSISDVIKGALKDYLSFAGYNAKFSYPHSGGINSLVEVFKRNIKNIHVNKELVKIYPNEKIVEFKDGSWCPYDKLILSVPLIELKDIIQADFADRVRKAFMNLRFNSIFNLNVGIKGDDPIKKHWIYFPHRDFTFFRVGFFSNFSNLTVPKNCYSIYAEVSYSNSKPLNKSIVTKKIIDDLIKIGILRSKSRIIARDVIDIKYGYAIYDKNHKDSVKVIIDYLRKYDVHVIGRYGKWSYMTMEDAILDGKKVSKLV